MLSILLSITLFLLPDIGYWFIYNSPWCCIQMYSIHIGSPLYKHRDQCSVCGHLNLKREEMQKWIGLLPITSRNHQTLLIRLVIIQQLNTQEHCGLHSRGPWWRSSQKPGHTAKRNYTHSRFQRIFSYSLRKSVIVHVCVHSHHNDSNH